MRLAGSHINLCESHTNLARHRPCRVIDQIRRIMQEGQGITPRTATVLETWFASYTKAGGFKDDPIPKDLDLVESGEASSAALLA